MSARIRAMLALVVALAGVVVTVGLVAAWGSPVWQADGVEMCGASNDQEDPQIVSDGSGGVIVTWRDSRDDGTTGYDIYAQRVTTSIVIGVASAQSGPISFLGWPQANAVQLAISQTNAAGGVDIGGVTYTLVTIAADSACNPTQAVTAANSLLDAGVVAVVGHTCSPASMAAQPLYNGAGVAMVSASSSSPLLTEPGYTTTFRVISRDDAGAALMAYYFRQGLGMDTVALVGHAGLEYGPQTFSDTFTSLGGTISSLRKVTSTDDYTATLTAILPEDPDAVCYSYWVPEDAGLFSSIAHTSGMTDVVVGWDSLSADEAALADYVAAAGVTVEGDYVASSSRRIQDMPGYDALNADYQAAGFSNYGDEAGTGGAFAYDAAKIIIDAIDRADSADPGAIRDAIAATVDYDGVVGTYQGFDSKGDVIPQWAWLVRYLDGEWVEVRFQVSLPLLLKKAGS